MNLLTNILFPKKCLGCSREGSFVCQVCFDKIPASSQEFSLNPLNKIIIASDYNNPLLKNIIWKYKYNFIKELSSPLSDLMIRELKYINLKNLILIPVPLHRSRLKWRGFNQSELLALKISEALDIPVNINIIEKIKNTTPQVKISNKFHREDNIQNAFQVNQVINNNFKNKTIILVDDICTTGNTLQECAKTLKPLGPKSIWGLVVARG